MESELPPNVYYPCLWKVVMMPKVSPLFRAVIVNDLNSVKTLVEGGQSVNVQDSEGRSLLNFVMKLKRKEIFDYLMGLEETDVNHLDYFEQSPLKFLTGQYCDEYFAMELLKKDADVNLIDSRGFTYLHLAASSGSSSLRVGQMVIENGANINQEGENGVTPLYAACEAGNFDWICMLLYYGVDVTIPAHNGVLPLAVISQNIPENQRLHLQDIFFNYTFDKHKVTLQLSTLVASITLNSSLFSKILQHISDVDYDIIQLEYLVKSLLFMNPETLKLFVENFDNVVKDMIQNFPIIDILLAIAIECAAGESLKEIFDTFLESEFAEAFVQSSDSKNSVISHMLEVFREENQLNDEDELKTMICLMLSYGLTVTSVDLDAIYYYFGNCDLFRMMLHMDLMILSKDKIITPAALFYNPLLCIDDIDLDLKLCITLLDFYNHSRIKEFVVMNSNDEENILRVKNLPRVPLLLELSRNAARQYVVKKFNVKNSAQFYTILQWLPIGSLNRGIIAMETKLY